MCLPFWPRRIPLVPFPPLTQVWLGSLSPSTKSAGRGGEGQRRAGLSDGFGAERRGRPWGPAPDGHKLHRVLLRVYSQPGVPKPALTRPASLSGRNFYGSFRNLQRRAAKVRAPSTAHTAVGLFNRPRNRTEGGSAAATACRLYPLSLSEGSDARFLLGGLKLLRRAPGTALEAQRGPSWLSRCHPSRGPSMARTATARSPARQEGLRDTPGQWLGQGPRTLWVSSASTR